MSPTHPSLLALPYTLLFPWSCPGPSPREEEGELGFLKRTADLAKSRLTSAHSSSCQQLQDCSKPRAVSPGSIAAVRIEAVGPCLPALTPHPSRRAPHLRVKVDSCVTLVGRSPCSPLLTPLPALPGDRAAPGLRWGGKRELPGLAQVPALGRELRPAGTSPGYSVTAALRVQAANWPTGRSPETWPAPQPSPGPAATQGGNRELGRLGLQPWVQ